MIRMTMSTIVFATLAATGCGADADQVITGRIKSSTFPEPVTAVRAIGTSTTVEAAVPADGSFSIRLPAAERYRIELVSAARRSALVFPRITGSIDTTFFVEAGGTALELGTVRYLRDPAGQSYEFDDGAACEDGETASGSVCVRDTGTGGGQDTGTGGGQDTGTGGGQDPGRPKGEGDGAGDRPCGDGVGQPDGAGSVEGDAAIGDYNLPAEIGCSGDGDTGTGGGQDTGTGGGQDTGTGGGGG